MIRTRSSILVPSGENATEVIQWLWASAFSLLSSRVPVWEGVGSAVSSSAVPRRSATVVVRSELEVPPRDSSRVLATSLRAGKLESRDSSSHREFARGETRVPPRVSRLESQDSRQDSRGHRILFRKSEPESELCFDPRALVLSLSRSLSLSLLFFWWALLILLTRGGPFNVCFRPVTVSV